MSFIHPPAKLGGGRAEDDYNGPICYTTDGNPLVGPHRGCRKCGWPKVQFRHHGGGREAGHYPRADDGRGRGEIDMAPLDPNATGRG